MSSDEEILRQMKLRALRSEAQGRTKASKVLWNLYSKFLATVTESKERRDRECQKQQLSK